MEIRKNKSSFKNILMGLGIMILFGSCVKSECNHDTITRELLETDKKTIPYKTGYEKLTFVKTNAPNDTIDFIGGGVR